ncbi:hypothetical protein PSPO01_14754 [Paraphaeosphaeria sporulosa]
MSCPFIGRSKSIRIIHSTAAYSPSHTLTPSLAKRKNKCLILFRRADDRRCLARSFSPHNREAYAQSHRTATPQLPAQTTTPLNLKHGRDATRTKCMQILRRPPRTPSPSPTPHLRITTARASFVNVDDVRRCGCVQSNKALLLSNLRLPWWCDALWRLRAVFACGDNALHISSATRFLCRGLPMPTASFQTRCKRQSAAHRVVHA